jgi:hypothetical protein
VAAATFSESSTDDMGIRACRQEDARATALSPGPSDPTMSATGVEDASARVRREGDDEPSLGEGSERGGPRLAAREPTPKHRAHGGLDRSAIQGVGATGREDDIADALDHGRPDREADICRIDEILKDEYVALGSEHLGHVDGRGARHDRECAAMDSIAGDVLKETLVGDKHIHIRCRECRLQALQPAPRGEHGVEVHTESGAAFDDEVTFGHEHATLGLHTLT